MCTNCKKKLKQEVKEDVSDVVMAVENLNIVNGGLIDTHIILSDYINFFVREHASDTVKTR